MPANVPAELEDKFKSCKEKVISSGEYDEQSAYAICYSAVVEGKADAASIAGKCGFILDMDTVNRATKLMTAAIKAVGDWELDVLAAPFNKPDSDGQIFDRNTNFMLDDFSAPAILYHHGVMPGKAALQKAPVIIGKAEKPFVRDDGLHVKVILNKTIDWARRVWEAAKKGDAVASSDSISHLARLETNGKTIMYEKDRPGRIAVWPLAGVSLWDAVSENFRPASRYALALPAMKAIYRDNGIPFPTITLSDTDGALLDANDMAVKRARAIRDDIRKFLDTHKEKK